MNADEEATWLVDANHAVTAGMVIGYLNRLDLNAQPLSVFGEYTADFTLEIPDLGVVTLRVLPNKRGPLPL